MRKTYQQMLGSFLTIFILAMVITVPFWISEELKEVETARSDLIPFQQIVSSEIITWDNETITTYEPYWQSNSTNIGYLYWSNSPISGPGHAVLYNVMADAMSYTHDANGKLDLYYITSYSSSNSLTFNFYYDLSFTDLINDNANQIYINISSSLDYQIGTISAMGTDSNHQSVDNSVWADKPTDWGTTRTGSNQFLTTLDTTFLNAGASSQTHPSAVNEVFRLTINIPNGYHGSNFYIDVQVSPEYYEEQDVNSSSSTEYVNSTVTSYEPYILTYSNPSTWTRITLWFDGILLVGVSVLISPFFNLSMFKLNLKKKRRRRK